MKTYVKQNISYLGNETNYSTFHRARKNKVSMSHMHCSPLFFIHDKSKSSGSITLLPVKFSRLRGTIGSKFYQLLPEKENIAQAKD